MGWALSGDTSKRAELGEIFTRDFVLLATVNLAMFFGFQMTTVGIPVYMAQLGAEAHIVGLATTLMTVTATAVRVFSGAMLDRFGRGGLLVGGIFVMLCSIISYAVFPVVGIIMGLRLVQGIGWGAGSTASSTMAADIIPKRRFAEGMGYFALTNAISSALAPAVSIELAQGAGGAYMVYVAAAVVALSLALSIVQVLLSRKDGKPKDATPRGGVSEGGASGQGSQGGNSGRQAGFELAANPHGVSPANAPGSKFDVLFERRAFIPSALTLFVNIGFGCITTFIALHAAVQGVGNVTPYFIVYAVVTLVSRPAIGRLIDRFGYRVPAILSTLCTAGTLALIGASSNVFMFALAGVLGGLGLGTAMGTFQAMAVASVEPWRRGVATSTYMTAFDLGIAIGSLVGGLLANACGYSVMYFVMALFPLAACMLSFVLVKAGGPRA